jgi:hypothetical protein
VTDETAHRPAIRTGRPLHAIFVLVIFRGAGNINGAGGTHSAQFPFSKKKQALCVSTAKEATGINTMDRLWRKTGDGNSDDSSDSRILAASALNSTIPIRRKTALPYNESSAFNSGRGEET